MAPVLNKIAGHLRRGRDQMPTKVAGTGPWRSVFAFLLLTLGLGLWVKVVSAGLPGSLGLPENGSALTAPGYPNGNADNAPAVEMNAPLSPGVDFRAARPASVLYDQFMDASINSASSQNFEPR